MNLKKDNTRKGFSMPAWDECSEKIDDGNGALNPLEKVIYDYDIATPQRSSEFVSAIENLVEWCVNNPSKVKNLYEKN